jgi:hypothetical protein
MLLLRGQTRSLDALGASRWGCARGLLCRFFARPFPALGSRGPEPRPVGRVGRQKDSPQAGGFRTQPARCRGGISSVGRRCCGITLARRKGLGKDAGPRKGFGPSIDSRSVSCYRPYCPAGLGFERIPRRARTWSASAVWSINVTRSHSGRRPESSKPRASAAPSWVVAAMESPAYKAGTRHTTHPMSQPFRLDSSILRNSAQISAQQCGLLIGPNYIVPFAMEV